MDVTLPADILARVIIRTNDVAHANAPLFVEALKQPNVVRFIAYDGHMAITTEVPSGDGVEIRETGAVMMPFTIHDFLRTLRGPIQLEVSRRGPHGVERIHVRMGNAPKPAKGKKRGTAEPASTSNSNTELTAYPPRLASDFVNLKDGAVETAPVAAGALLEMLKRVEHAVCKDSTRISINGVFLGARTAKNGKPTGVCYLVATDGSRLAVHEKQVGVFPLPARGIILPQPALKTLMQALTEDTSEGWEAGASDGVFVIAKGQVRFMARTVDSTFPEWARLIPEETHFMRASREKLAAMLERVCVFQGKTSHVKVTLVPNTPGRLDVELTHVDGHTAHDFLPVTYAGPAVTNAFDGRFLLETLYALGDSEDVLLQIPEPLKGPMLVRVPDDMSFTGLVMPKVM